jgi:hypothetical protein
MTALEWFVKQIIDGTMPIEYVIQKAKEMEKEQIENAFNYGQVDLGMEADEYYNNNFKSE